MIIYVDGSALRPGDGTERSPFKTISEAAAKALPGDEVLVAPGMGDRPDPGISSGI